MKISQTFPNMGVLTLTPSVIRYSDEDSVSKSSLSVSSNSTVRFLNFALKIRKENIYSNGYMRLKRWIGSRELGICPHRYYNGNILALLYLRTITPAQADLSLRVSHTPT